MLNRYFDALKGKPELYAASDGPFWDDEHISAQMLEAHLNPDWDAASRTRDFMVKSAEWLASKFSRGGKLLDLGCGPGLYAQLMTEKGLDVTGIDISRRSIAYAQEHFAGEHARFIRGDYITTPFGEGYDAAMIIYKDLGVLSPENRAIFLNKTYAALKTGGVFVMDACSVHEMTHYTENRETEYCNGGFWRGDDHIVVSSNYLYPETANWCDQYVVISREGGMIYNTWNQMYSRESLSAELSKAGFADIEFYSDAAGAEYDENSDTICAVCRKK